MGCPGKWINNDKVQKQANAYQDIQYSPEYLYRRTAVPLRKYCSSIAEVLQYRYESTGSMPRGMQGMAIALVTAGLLAMAFMGFSGVDAGLAKALGL